MKDEHKALVRYRLEQADESLESSKILLEKEMFRPSVSRAYYAMFYSVLALLTLSKQKTAKHSGAIALFDREFIKKGFFDKEMSKWIHGAFDLRQRADYREMFTLSTDRASEVLDHAEMFVENIKKQIPNIVTHQEADDED